MRSKRSAVQPKGILALLCGLVGACALSLFVRLPSMAANVWPFWNDPFEFEWSDGDHLGIVARIHDGLPIYGSWAKGIVLNIYPPVYEYTVAAINEIFGISGGISGAHARQLNILCWLGTIALFAVTYAQGAPAKRQARVDTNLWRALTVVLAAAFFTLSFSVFNIVNWMRPDALALFLSAAILSWTFWWERSSQKTEWPLFPLAALCVAAVFTKQQNVATVLAVLIWFAARKPWRTRALKLGALCGLSALAVVAFLEFKNQGTFLESVFFSVAKAFGPDVYLEDGQKVLNWSVPLFALQTLYLPCLAISGLALFGTYAAWKEKSLSVLHPAYLIVGALSLKFSRNSAGSISYYWTHWWLTSVLAAQAAVWLCRRAKQADPLWITGTLILACVAVFELRGDPFPALIQSLRPERSLQDERAYEFMKDHWRSAPGQIALLDRGTGPALGVGLLSEVDGRSLYHAFMGHATDVDPLVQNIAHKRYALISLSYWMAKIPPIAAAVDQYYVRAPELDNALYRDNMASRYYLPR